jgi:RHS repeat-associated protein
LGDTPSHTPQATQTPRPRPTSASTTTKPVTLKRNGLTIECFYSENGRLHKKIEHFGDTSTEFIYHFDTKGHLLKVFRNKKLVEEYTYNQIGQRILTKREYRGCYDRSKGHLEYDSQGKLIKAGDYSFTYNKHGALAQCRDRWDTTKFSYGNDTLLDKVHLSYGGKVWYEYDPVHRIVPAKRFRNEYLVAEYVWRDALRLSKYLDHEHCLEYTFIYDKNEILDRMRIVRKPYRELKPRPNFDVVAASRDWPYLMRVEKTMRSLHALFEKYGEVLDLRCCTDQVGTLRLLTDMQGRPVKEIRRDSFGVKLYDSLPELYMPIGFAGGLQDPATGFVRFGYRDYDPDVGRFTAPDPLGDTGGDHDLYDYCVDDPVTMNDPTGLYALPAIPYAVKMALAGAAGAIGKGLVVPWGVAKVMGREDAVEAVASKVVGAKGAAAAVALGKGSGAVAGAVLRTAARVHSSRHGDKIIEGATHAVRAAEGYASPPSAPSSPAGAAGMLATIIVKAFREWQHSRK